MCTCIDKRDTRSKLFTQGMVNMWDELLGEAAVVGTITMSKRCLDRYMDGHGLEGYGPSPGELD